MWLRLRNGEGKKKVCPFLLLENSSPISVPWKPQTTFSSSGYPDFLSRENWLSTTKYIPPSWMIINLLTHLPAKHSSTLSLRNTYIDPALAPNMPGEHTEYSVPSLSGHHWDHPTWIHAKSAHQTLHMNPCQVSTQTTHLHPCHVITKTTPPPSMPGHHTDNTNSIHTRSAHRPTHLHPCRAADRPPQGPPCQ